ncbi:hypothetical protein PENARI_c060G05924 [Penicillium arizonense]|uniref:Uncharacterized protein n=1 Tax=Penicillium arizonense TaxID=1835702 RepID=A0A1F5L1P2_PENAI|nr:hypothetical protein PENARI_c060G05924 [Penicillium arizonense]OGE47143.1 hypothetical protein PENARI_c060G05924 [Penicillium arizonense]
MDAPWNVPDQNSGDQEPSGLPIQVVTGHPKDASDPKPRQLETNQKETLTTEHFQPILATLANLERDDPKLAFQAARSVGLYRRLWASCVPRHLSGEDVDQKIQISKEARFNPSKERNGPQLPADEQRLRLLSFEQALESSRERLTVLLNGWNQCSKSSLGMLVDVKRTE